MKGYFISLALLLLPALAASAGTTYYVKDGGDDGASGLDWDHAVANISTGVAKAVVAGDVVLVGDGVYTMSGPGTVWNSGTNIVHIASGITVRSLNGPGATAVDGGYPDTSYRAFGLNHADAVLEGFTIRNCQAYYGGGIYMAGGRVTNCWIINNIALPEGGGNGGGVYNSGTCRINNCIVSNNYCGYIGGGVYMAGANSLLANSLITSNKSQRAGGGVYSVGTVSNCTVSYNSCTNYVASPGYARGYGGGVYGGSVLNCTNISYNIGGRGAGVSEAKFILNSTIFSNTCVFQAGGIWASSGCMISNCFIYGNRITGVGAGGGVFFYQVGPNVILDSVISNNYTPTTGGGICFTTYAGVTGAVYNCTIVNNTANTYGGGLFISREPGINNTYVTVSNCTIRGNKTTYAGGGLIAYGNTSLVANCVIENNTASSGSGGGASCGPGVRVRNCLFKDNVGGSGQAGGGAYLNNLGSATTTGGYFSSCTVVSNRAGYGGGLALASTNNSVSNCIVYGNAAATLGPDFYATTEEQTNSMWYCSVPTNLPPAQGNRSDDPLFINPAAGNWRLATNSPCVDTGYAEAWMTDTIDLDGQLRIQGTNVDIGAFETSPFDPACAPADVQASDGEFADQVWVTWNSNACTNAAGYQVFRSENADPAGAALVGSSTATNYADPAALPALVPYYYWVRATNSYSIGDLSASNTGWRGLTAPHGVQAGDGEFNDKIRVTWETNLCTNAAGYQVWRSGTAAIDTNVAAPIGGSVDPPYDDTTATNGVLYYYWVQATNLTARSGLSESNTGYRALAPPVVTASDGVYSGKVAVTWATNACTNAEGYSVWRGTSADLGAAAPVAATAGTNYDDTSVLSNMLYYYWVQATNALSQTNTSAGGPDTGYWAQTYYVATNGSDANAGISWEMPYASISNAVTQAQRWMGGGVFVSNGAYTLAETNIFITNGISVRSWHDGAVDAEGTVVDGNLATRCFRVSHANALVEGLTIRNGTNALYGGGVYLEKGAQLSNCIVSGNCAPVGGGIYIGTAGVVVACTVRDNLAFTNLNDASFGGGVYLCRGGVISNCVIAGNMVSNSSLKAGPQYFNYSGGGGIAAEIRNAADRCRVYNSLISNNFSFGFGGGINLFQAGVGVDQMVVQNCTNVNNQALKGGGGIIAHSPPVCRLVRSGHRRRHHGQCGDEYHRQWRGRGGILPKRDGGL